MNPSIYNIIILENHLYIDRNTINLFESVFKHDIDLDNCINHIQSLPASSYALFLISLTHEDQIKWIKHAVNKISNFVPVIAYSNIEDYLFMLKCIQAGATNYVLYPIRIDIIKTLFLTIHQTHVKQPLLNSSTISTFTSSPSSASLPDHLKLFMSKDSNITKTILDTYVPLMSSPNFIKLTSGHKEKLRKDLLKWDFSPLNLSKQDLIHSVVIILSQVLPGHFTTAQLYGFTIDLENAYNGINPYHNFTHAVDVLQCIFYFISHLKNSSLLPQDCFALLIAAIGHDAAHPGVNNNFLINLSAPLALLYNDNSVLESFHTMTLFQILKKHHFDESLGGAQSDQYKEFRKIVITTILATDMSFHTDYVDRIKKQKFSRNKDLEQRLLFCSALIKCADISNVARPFSKAHAWAQILIEEFVSQGDTERDLGLPVLPLYDREKIVLEDSQIGFIKFVALDLFETVKSNIDELAFLVNQAEKNLFIWEKRKSEKEKEKKTDDPKVNASPTCYKQLSYMSAMTKPISQYKNKESPFYCQCSIQ